MKDSTIETISLNKGLHAVILASGRGSNARALLDYVVSDVNQNHKNPWKIKLIISENEDAGVLDHAKDFGIPTLVIPYEKGPKATLDQRRINFSGQLVKSIQEFDPEINFAICAGFMKVLTKEFLGYFKDSQVEINRVLNIHPSLLPSFVGANAYKDAYEYGVKVSGATTHFVEEEVDRGPIILQDSFSRHFDDTLEDFQGRGLKIEHPLFVRTLQVIQDQKINLMKTNTERLTIKVTGE